MSIVVNKDWTKLDEGYLRRVFVQFSITTEVLNFKYQCTRNYNIIDRVIHLHDGAVSYSVFRNPTSNGGNPIIVPLFRLNTQVTASPICSAFSKSVTFEGGELVDNISLKTAQGNSASTLPDSQVGGRKFTKDDVFFIQIKRLAGTSGTVSGSLTIITEELE